MPREDQPVELIARSRAGERDAFAALFHRYKNLVYRTAYLMLGNAEEAEDSLQEVFLQVHRGLSTFEPSKGAFTTWLHRITVNHCLNRQRKRRPFTLSLDGVSQMVHIDHTASPEDRVGEEEEVQRALSRLSEKLRAVVVLRYYWDLSHLEISEVLSIPVGTVKSRLDLALKTMRKELETAAGGPSAQQSCLQREVSK